MTLEQRLKELAPYPKGASIVNPWKLGIDIKWEPSLNGWTAQVASTPTQEPRLDGTLESVLLALQHKIEYTSNKSVDEIIQSWAKIDWSTSVEELRIYSTKKGIGLSILEDASWAAYLLTPTTARRTRFEDRLTSRPEDVVWSQE